MGCPWEGPNEAPRHLDWEVAMSVPLRHGVLCFVPGLYRTRGGGQGAPATISPLIIFTIAAHKKAARAAGSSSADVLKILYLYVWHALGKQEI